MAVKTREQYIESLRKGRPSAFILGKRVDDIVGHPINRPAVNAIAESFALANDRKEQRVANTESHLTGQPVNRYNALHMSVEDLVARGEMERHLATRTAAGCPRSTGLDAINAVYSVAYEADQARGTGYLERFKAWMKSVEENDLAVSGAMTDVKGDRSKRPAQPRTTPTCTCTSWRKNKKGVVVRGAKAHQTGAVNCNEHLVMPTRGMREDEKDYAICFSLPVDAPGLYHIYGRQPSDTRKLEEGASIDLGLPRFGGCETLMMFDEVFVPWERVFLCGEIEYTWPLVNRFAIGHRSSYGVAGAGVGDVAVGAVVAMAEANGVSKDKIIWDKIADLIIMSETLYGLGPRVHAQGQAHPVRASIFADYVLGGVAKYNATQLPFLMCSIAQDICGGLVATMPGEMDLRNDEVGPLHREIPAGRVAHPHRTPHAHGAPDRMHVARNLRGGPAHHGTARRGLPVPPEDDGAERLPGQAAEAGAAGHVSRGHRRRGRLSLRHRGRGGAMEENLVSIFMRQVSERGRRTALRGRREGIHRHNLGRVREAVQSPGRGPGGHGRAEGGPRRRIRLQFTRVGLHRPGGPHGGRAGGPHIFQERAAAGAIHPVGLRRRSGHGRRPRPAGRGPRRQGLPARAEACHRGGRCGKRRRCRRDALRGGPGEGDGKGTA